MNEATPGLTPQYEHELTFFSQEQFFERFENFHLIFVTDNPPYPPTYMADVKGFLKEKHLSEYKELKRIFEQEAVSKKTVQKHIDDLYKIYTALRKEGHFSNSKLGVTYW